VLCKESPTWRFGCASGTNGNRKAISPGRLNSRLLGSCLLLFVYLPILWPAEWREKCKQSFAALSGRSSRRT
jgi:hypothetical protein